MNEKVPTSAMIARDALVELATERAKVAFLVQALESLGHRDTGVDTQCVGCQALRRVMKK